MDKKQAIALLHKERILESAKNLFYSQGYKETTIDDLSKHSQYSRRTIYTYFINKEDILNHLIEKELLKLYTNIEQVIADENDYFSCWINIWNIIAEYVRDNRMINDMIINVNSTMLAQQKDSVTKSIIELGKKINEIQQNYLITGQRQGKVKKDIDIKITVYMFYSIISVLSQILLSKDNSVGCSWQQVYKQMLGMIEEK
ncbi:MAG: TetR/AcrR family transcriptional regulator [Erysipelotrichia bacterium]|nr:TetR/AcrR family transcriptional regulator [Erysipelotrichia bacterium]